MTVFILEDEPILRRQEEQVLRRVLPEADLVCFGLAREALEAIEQKDRVPDVVFSDIEMPGMNGLSFAVRVKSLCPEAKIIFVTGYPDYAVEAYRIHAGGYIMKPLEPERVREELEALSVPVSHAKSGLQVRCFGDFEVFWKGAPLLFDRRQTKELFAFMVDHEGRLCTSEEIIAALWEEDDNVRAAKGRLRNLISDLKQTLERIGMGEVLIRKSGLIAIRREMLDCDYYRMLEGDMTALNAYRGEYMKQYSWAEGTAGALYFRHFG